MTQTTILISVLRTGDDHAYSANVYQQEGSEMFDLSWSDGINTWSERYPTLAVALLRLGALDHAVRSDMCLAQDDAHGFVPVACDFLLATAD